MATGIESDHCGGWKPKHNIEVMWLLKKLLPDHKTIARFRHDNATALKNVFRDFTKLCLKLGLFGKELAAIDGSKFKAVNSKERNFNEAKLNDRIKRLDTRINEYMQQLNESDKEEDNQEGVKIADIKQIVAKLQSRKTTYQSYLEELTTSGENQKSLTDPDSKLMRGHDKLDAVNDCAFDGDAYLQMFLASGLAEQFARGNPKIIAGKSGVELAQEVIRLVTGNVPSAASRINEDRSAEYWAGWALAQYQWYTAKSFASILRAMPFFDIVQMYPTFHEADITRFYSVAADIYNRKSPQTNLKRIRDASGFSQAQLAAEAEVSLRSIQMYEQRNKDINKAQAITLTKIARVLGCQVEDLLEVEA